VRLRIIALEVTSCLWILSINLRSLLSNPSSRGSKIHGDKERSDFSAIPRRELLHCISATRFLGAGNGLRYSGLRRNCITLDARALIRSILCPKSTLLLPSTPSTPNKVFITVIFLLKSKRNSKTSSTLLGTVFVWSQQNYLRWLLRLFESVLVGLLAPRNFPREAGMKMNERYYYMCLPFML